MKILITGTTQGIGQAIAKLFLKKGHEVIGIDRQPSSISDENYTHYICDIRDRAHLPEIANVNILVNNAGTQNEEDIDINPIYWVGGIDSLNYLNIMKVDRQVIYVSYLPYNHLALFFFYILSHTLIQKA